jgi:hypothetical protein
MVIKATKVFYNSVENQKCWDYKILFFFGYWFDFIIANLAFLFVDDFMYSEFTKRTYLATASIFVQNYKIGLLSLL